MDFTSQAVDNLVTQFSSALDFYRELVQNSIDAGSAAIEIWLDYVPDESGGANGVIEIHVDDAGEGMNEEIIDGQLTTLFSSTKEDDLTKIGKFGIGFVSVFALEPKAVLVQTGRDGEYWEVFFDQDRSFFKSPLATPIEGTQITLFIEGDPAGYTDLVARSRATIDHWCRHSEAEIHFEDRASLDGISEVINRPFAVDGVMGW
jgi:HSP90 family molecular chaperone